MPVLFLAKTTHYQLKPANGKIVSLDKYGIYHIIELLEDYGPDLKQPYSKHLEDGIFELRVKFSSNITRTLYFFAKGKRIILTNDFVKKHRKHQKKK